MAKPVLGRGLGALLGGVASVAKASPFSPAPSAASEPVAASQKNESGVQRVALGRVRPCPFQPRKDFSEDALRELADSIKEKGIVQPLLVRQRGENFELIAGERRWRAAQLVGLAEVPIIIREADDRDVLELALIENLQRENLNPIEEALGYGELVSRFQLTQEEVAAKVGKSRAVVANSLRLLKLAPDVQSHVREGRISIGHAKVILGLDTYEKQALAIERILKNSLSVRQTEELVSLLQNATSNNGKASSKNISTERDPHIVDLEHKLHERLGTKIQLRYRQGKGSLEIKFFNDDDLERILKIVGVNVD